LRVSATLPRGSTPATAESTALPRGLLTESTTETAALPRGTLTKSTATTHLL
jgi:hypothetical protein